MDDEILYERKLPVREIAADSYGYVWANRGALILPLALLLILDLFITWLTQRTSAPGATPGTAVTLGQFALAWLWIFGAMAFAVGLHRRILLDEPRQDFALLSPTRTLLAYMWTALKTSVAMGLIAALLMLPVGVYQGVTTAATGQKPSVEHLLPNSFAAILVSLLIAVRLMLSLPGAATGGERSLRQSWRMTRGNWGRLIVIVLLVALPFQLPSLAVQLISLGDVSWAASVFNAILTIAALPVMTVALSLSYRTLVPAEEQ